MAGEINGTKVLLKKGAAEILGTGDVTMTMAGTPIDISSKSTGDWVVLMDGELSGKQVTIAVTLNFNSSADFIQMRADARSGTQAAYTLEYVSDSATDESITGQFVPNGLSDAIPRGDKVTSTFNLLSSGAVTVTPQVA
jgi:hypothetical protein